MKIIYSNLSLEEVMDIRNNMINNSVVGAVQNSIIIISEKLLLAIAYCLEAVLVVVMLCKAYLPVCGILAKRMTELQLYGMPALFFVIAVIIIRSLWIVTEKGHKTLAVKLFPEKTKKIEQDEKNYEFAKNTENIEEVLRQQDKLKDFIVDSEPRFELLDNALVVSKDGVGCRESHTFHLPENIITGIKENGVLDFSYIDGEWKKAIHDASMSKLLEF
jgi:hypothetical protein